MSHPPLRNGKPPTPKPGPAMIPLRPGAGIELFQQVIAGNEDGDFKQAVDLLQEASDKNDSEAMAGAVMSSRPGHETP